jgi:hypothetical protein
MRVLASPEASALVHKLGGYLYVWPKHFRCCGGVMFLEAATSEPPRGVLFRSVAAEPFVVLFPESTSRVPDELHVEVRGRGRRRVEAYWDGCAYVI